MANKKIQNSAASGTKTEHHVGFGCDSIARIINKIMS